MRTKQQWRAETEQLWEQGLARRGQRNEALFNLAIDLARRGVPRQEAAPELRRWLLDKNNGVSATFNRDVAVALRDVEPIVATVYERSRRRSAGTWGSPHPLSDYEVRMIQAALDHDEARTDPETGELMARYEIERFLFELARRAKEWIAVQAAKATRAREPLSSWIWPDQTRAGFVVQIPKAMRRKIRGFGRHRDVDLWRTLVRHETLPRVQASSAKAGRGARYLMRLDFGALSEGSQEFSRLAAALTNMMTPAALEQRYGADDRARIQQDALAAPAAAARDPLSHESFVRERLGAAPPGRREARAE